MRPGCIYGRMPLYLKTVVRVRLPPESFALTQEKPVNSGMEEINMKLGIVIKSQFLVFPYISLEVDKYR